MIYLQLLPNKLRTSELEINASSAAPEPVRNQIAANRSEPKIFSQTCYTATNQSQHRADLELQQRAPGKLESVLPNLSLRSYGTYSAGPCSELLIILYNYFRKMIFGV